MIRAKMQVQSVTKLAGGTEIVKLNAVYSGTPEDNTYAKATPSASMEMHIDNPGAQGKLLPGEEVLRRLHRGGELTIDWELVEG